MSATDTAVSPRGPVSLQAEAEPAPEPRRQYICFCVDGEWLALPIQRVREVQVLPPLTRVPNAPAEVVGIVNLRGRVLTLLSLPTGGDPAGSAPPTHCLVLDLGESDPYVGLAVHGVGEVVSVPLSAVEPTAAGAQGPGDLEGIVQIGGRVVGLLDLGRTHSRLLGDWGISLAASRTS
jgi:purine-binding chemotaxis protein CheW